MSAAAEITGRQRAAITVSAILATLIYSLDTTIANIALPHIQASVAAAQDQIIWVLTSYIVASAIMTPATGFLAGRFGLKRIYLCAVCGFVFASMLCGVAQSLTQIVVFRALQGICGAALVPLAQAVLMSIYPKERQGGAMALYGVSVMVGPILGPILGGWLTENYSWRWVFYINVPIGALAFLGLSTFLAERPKDAAAKLDWFGFGSLGLAIAAFQLMLDRGEQLDWFSSGEIVTEAIVSAAALYVFIVHTFTSQTSFLRPQLLRDRNFIAGLLFNVILGLTYYASLALLPTYLQHLMNYPVVTAGLTLGPQGMGSMAAMLVAGRLVGRVDTRILLAIGLGLAAYAFHETTLWTPDVAQTTVMRVGVIQGASIGFLFVPLTVVTLSTLPPSLIADGAGFSTLVRSIASGAGISIVTALLTQNTQQNHAEIAAHVTQTNRMFENPVVSHIFNPLTAAGQAALDAMITREAQIIAYIDDYKLLLVATLAVVPLLLVFKPARKRPAKAADGAHL